MNKIKVYDTTLRDGEQAPNNAMTLEKKIQGFYVLDQLNFDYIDLGFPFASELDYQFSKMIIEAPRNTPISMLARANAEDIKLTANIMTAEIPDQLQILLLGSEIHVQRKRNISIADALEETKNAVVLAKAMGIKDISAALEDASRGSIDYLKQIIDVAITHGATTLVIPDTVGFCLPEEMAEKITYIREFVGSDISVSVHCHNDLGLAVANTLAAISAGADCIQTTLCGVGERAGNAAFEEILAAFYYKDFNHKIDVDVKKVYLACLRLSQLMNYNIPAHKPLLGSNAFRTAAGIHMHGIINDPDTYEYIKPEHFGRRREFIINRLSGRGAISYLLNQKGIEAEKSYVEQIYHTISSVTDELICLDEETLTAMYHDLQAQRTQKELRA
ncbi:MAG: LeuA family protein [Gammaproteobacteria bacterium]